MCGRYSFTSPAEAVRRYFDLLGPFRWNFEPMPDIRPTDRAPVVRLNAEGARELVALRWWLVPRWAKEVSQKYTMFNAAGETLAERASFREPFKTRRCLVPADGFFEWPLIEGKKVKHWLGMKSGELFAMAGLWERAERLPDGPLESFTIVTTAANDLVTRYHPKARMPVILDPSAFDAWLDPKTPMNEVRELITAYPDEAMAAKRAA
ncbi:MAG: SOS response-associated peptidase [Alphaproteobacteria bacterium]|nr:SOS response-associated peptidase [Alphaproteobacteria bacterium]